MQLLGRLESRLGEKPPYMQRDVTLRPRRRHPCDQFPILLFPGVAMAPEKFATVEALAERLVRLARRDPLDCGGRDAFVSFPGDQTRRVVAVWTLMEGGSRNRFLGYAWLNGRPDSHAILTHAVRTIEQKHATRPAA